MAYSTLDETLRDFRPGDLITVRHRGEDYTVKVSAVDISTEKPDIYGQQYHVLAQGKTTQYRLFSTEYGPQSTVIIKYNVANSPHSPVWKCIGAVDDISQVRQSKE